MANEIDYNKEHHCPVYNKTIDPDLCYDSVLCLCGVVKAESMKEIRELDDIEEARKKCKACPYSDLN